MKYFSAFVSSNIKNTFISNEKAIIADVAGKLRQWKDWGPPVECQMRAVLCHLGLPISYSKSTFNNYLCNLMNLHHSRIHGKEFSN